MPLEQAVEEHPELVEEHFGKRLPYRRGQVRRRERPRSGPAACSSTCPKNVRDREADPGGLADRRARHRPVGAHARGGRRARRGARSASTSSRGDFEGQALHAGAFELYAQPGAQVHLAHYQDWGRGEVYDLSTRRVEVRRDARVKWVPIHLGGRLTKQTLDIITAEQGSDMRHTGMYFTERDEHLDLFTTRQARGRPHHRRHRLEGRAHRRVAGVLRGPDPHPAEGARGGHLPPDAPDAAVAEGEGRRDPVADRRGGQREGLARRHRRRARPRADLLHDDPRHLARRGGARAGRGVLRGGRQRLDDPGLEDLVRRRISEKLAGAEEQVREFIGERAEAS